MMRCRLKKYAVSDANGSSLRHGCALALALLRIPLAFSMGLVGFVGIGMTIGWMPVIGIPLPFISYGGSAMVVDLFAMGVLLSISREGGHGFQGGEG